jgi:hypothetical protein
MSFHLSCIPLHSVLSQTRLMLATLYNGSVTPGLGKSRVGPGFEQGFTHNNGLEWAPQHFWRGRDYDFNIRNDRQFVEKVRYIHRHPANAGLCGHAEDWGA